MGRSGIGRWVTPALRHKAFHAWHGVRRFRHVLLLLTTLPLAWATFTTTEFEQTYLRFDSSFHWLWALVASGLFFGTGMLLLERGQAERKRLLCVGAFTGTLGIAFLFLVQKLAQDSEQWSVYGTTETAILHYILRAIAYSYQAAENPFNGFVESLLGFTLGVGLCEEIVKALPVLWGLSRDTIRRWEEACIIGFMSGVGFGISEGIHYAETQYNGVEAWPIYLIRFVSCVGFHGLLSAAGGLLLFRANIMATGWGYLGAVAWVLLPVMTLHGVYNTFCMREMLTYAVLAQVAVFLLFAAQIELARGFRWSPRSSPRTFRPTKRQALSFKERERFNTLLEKSFTEGIGALSRDEQMFLDKMTNRDMSF